MIRNPLFFPMLKLHPALLNLALMILVKSSKSVYNEIQPVFKLSTYSRLKQIQRETQEKKPVFLRFSKVAGKRV